MSILAVQPADTWGMKLGGNVNNVRNNGAYSEHRAKLEELGFVYKKNKKVVEIEWILKLLCVIDMLCGD